MGAFSDAVQSSASPKKLVNLLRGWPNTSLLPTQLLDRATHNVLKNRAVAYPAMCYGPDAGDPRLLKHVAHWLTSFYQPADAITEDRICITGGASQNLACILQVYSDPVYTRNVWIVAPAYMLSFRIFEDAGFSKKLRAVPEDNQGIDIAFLRQQIRTSEHNAKENGNNKPAKYDALIVTDDVYDFLQWPSSLASESRSLEKAVMPRIVDIDRYLDGGAERKDGDGFGNAVSNGSFSKICGPGLRTGWCEAGFRCTNACFVAETLETGELQRFVYERLQPSYCKRYRAMVDAIHKELVPLGVRLPQTDREVVGGYFIWLTLPDSVDGATLAQRAKDEQNVVVAQVSTEGALVSVSGF
ncbi:Valine--pyruvate aminotransferase [Pleosporales sp. CAS-2024a]